MPNILVDGSNLAMAAHYAPGDRLHDGKGRPTTCLFGFLRMLRPILERTQTLFPNEKVKVIVAWDSSRESLWRRDVYDGYKGSRDTKERTPEEEALLQEYVEQLPRLRMLLPALGVGQLVAQRHEADDLAGWLTRRHPGKWILASGDYDWLQLVSDDVWVWQPAKARYVTPENFTEVIETKYNTSLQTAEQYVRMKAITGDDGDDVPGCAGVGAGFAGKYIRGELTKGKKFDAIQAWVADPAGYERSLKLVDLRNLEIPLAALKPTAGAFSEQLVMDACVAYGFASIFDAFSGWITPFKAAV